MSILELAAKAKATLPAIETAVTQKGLIKQIDLITIQTKEMRVTRAGLTKEEQVALDRKLKQLHKRKIELEDMLESNNIEHKEAASVETAAPLSKEKYDWYKYVGARGTKITNSRGNREVILKNGSMFGVRPATTTTGKVRIVTAELGPTIVFSFDQAASVKIIQKGVRIPVKVTFKRPEAPAMVKRVSAAAKKAAIPKHVSMKKAPKSAKPKEAPKLTQVLVKENATKAARKFKLGKPTFRVSTRRPSGIKVLHMNFGGITKKELNPAIALMAEKLGLPKNKFYAYKSEGDYVVSLDMK